MDLTRRVEGLKVACDTRMVLMATLLDGFDRDSKVYTGSEEPSQPPLRKIRFATANGTGWLSLEDGFPFPTSATRPSFAFGPE